MTEITTIHDFILNNFGAQYVFWSLYVLNLIFSIVAYKLGFARQLPLLKSFFVYIVLTFGVFILTIFSIMKFPITEVLIITSLVLGIYRYRLHKTRQAKQ